MRHLFATFLLVAVFAAAPVAAGDIYAPDNLPASGTCNVFPWGSSNEWTYQALVPSGMMGGRAARIYEIAFAACGSGTFAASACEIRFAHFTGTSISTTFAKNLHANNTLVFKGALKYPYTSGVWSDIGLTSPFDYNGKDHVVVEIRYRGGSGGTSFHRSSTINRLYVSGSGASTATVGSGLGKAALKMRFKTIDILITPSGTPSPGKVIDLDLFSPGDSGLTYQVATALGKGPTKLGSRSIELTTDELMKVSVNNLLPFVFQGYSGKIDTQGKAKAKINIPNIAALKGVRFYTAFVTVDPKAPLGIKNISSAATISIQ